VVRMAEETRLVRPATLREALEMRAAAPCALLAGGTDFFPSLGPGAPGGTVLDIPAIAGLGDVDAVNGGVRIGANVTWADLCAVALPSGFDGLRDAAREIGAIQIQNRATLVGNICNASPAADGVPPLLTLMASVEIASTRGTRVVRLEAFITGVRQIDLAPDEIVTAILVPALSSDGAAVFKKLGSRNSLVISIVSVAVWLKTGRAGLVSDVRIAVGSCSAVACRLGALETSLTGTRADAATTREVVKEGDFSPLAPIDDVRGSKGFRQSAAREMVTRALIAAQNAEAGHV